MREMNFYKLSFSTIFVSILVGSGCSKEAVQFSVANPAIPDELNLDQGQGGDQGYKVQSESFTTASLPSKNVDMVWVVDNSGSMSQETKIIRDNLKSFIQNLEKAIGIRLALISQSSKIGAYVDLPEGATERGHIGIDRYVGSTNALSIISLFLATAESALNNFFRPNAQKVFVFVTDDDAKVSSEAFHAKLKSNFPNNPVTTYGFIGLETKQLSPCMARHGKQYKDLAELTGGSIFNICESDWSPYFKGLTDQVIDLATSRFELKAYPTSIVSLRLNGELLPTDDYSVVDNVLVLTQELVEDVGEYKIEVEYTYQ